MNVLIAGPAGYVGRRLLHRFGQESSVRLTVLVRDARRVLQDVPRQTEIVESDLLDGTSLHEAVRGIDVAYYPVRFASFERDFESRSREFARIFRDSCIEAGVKRIIHVATHAVHGSPDRVLSAMRDTTEILNAHPDKIQTICLFPGIIIGPGSVFCEMVMSLVKNVPFLFLPLWTKAEVKPVALSDLVEYLVRAASLDVKGNVMIEIGEERVTASDLFTVATRVSGLTRRMIHIPMTAPRASAFLLALATPLSYPLSFTIVQSLRALQALHGDSPADGARRYFHEVSPLTCEAAMEKAFAVTNVDEVESRWTDSLVGLSSVPSERDLRGARYRDVRQQDFGATPPSKVFLSVLSLGGEEGWFSFDSLWRIRGFMDKLLGGFGTSLGRRSPISLRIGDMLDVWVVMDLVENERLLLGAQMEVFGHAWLEFRLQGTTLVQTAYYDPGGLMGRLYWYAMLPFHAFIFPDMVKSIVKRAQEC